MFGSHEAVGFNGQVSFDRYTRYGAYGLGEDESHVSNWIKPSKVKWNEVDWSDLQHQCYDRNAARFSQKDDGLSEEKQHIAPESRSAVLIRTYVGKKYTENDLQVIRSMVTELSLQSGGEYSVFLLLHVKDSNLPIDQVEVYRKVLTDNVPEEFWNMTILWNVPMVAARYPNLDHNVIEYVHMATASLIESELTVVVSIMRNGSPFNILPCNIPTSTLCGTGRSMLGLRAITMSSPTR
jgi:hypothetical protein